MKKYLPIALLIINLLALDLLVGFGVYQYLNPKVMPTPPLTATPFVEPISTPTLIPIVTPTPSPTSAVIVPKPKTKTRSVTYVPIPGSGSTLQNDWADISGSDFYFDPAEIPGLTDARFEVNLKLINGNGQAGVRLYDVTHKIGVINSEVYTSSQTTVLTTSGAINFWSGRNQYRVQAKSLTADTAVFESGRLRVVIEN